MGVLQLLCSKLYFQDDVTSYSDYVNKFRTRFIVITLSSQAKANIGSLGCQATVKVGVEHGTSAIFSPVSTIA